MTIPLQPTRDSFILQSRTAPVEGAAPAIGVSATVGVTGANDEAFGTTAHKIQRPRPKHNLSVSTRDAARPLYPGFSPGVSGPLRKVCRPAAAVENEPRWGPFGVTIFGWWQHLVWALLSKSGYCFASERHWTAGILNAPTVAEIPHDQIHNSDLLIFQKAQANCVQTATGVRGMPSAWRDG